MQKTIYLRWYAEHTVSQSALFKSGDVAHL